MRILAHYAFRFAIWCFVHRETLHADFDAMHALFCDIEKQYLNAKSAIDSK
jgi:hypothetical protein